MFYLDLMAINPIPIVSLTSFPATLWPHKLPSVFQTSYVCPHLGPLRWVSCLLPGVCKACSLPSFRFLLSCHHFWEASSSCFTCHTPGLVVCVCVCVFTLFHNIQHCHNKYMCVTLFIICSQTCQFYSIGIYVPCSLVVPVPRAAVCVYQVLDICWIHDECDCPLQLLKYTQSSVGQPLLFTRASSVFLPVPPVFRSVP